MNKIQVNVIGIAQASSGPNTFVLFLKEINGRRQLPIVIGLNEAQAIALELEGIVPPRPLTHDLIKNVIDGLNANLNEIVITELREGTFYARLYLELNNRIYEIDSRPSDAVAIAVRCGAPIFVNEEIMEEAGMVIEEEEEEEIYDEDMPGHVEKTEKEEDKPKESDDMLSELQKQLDDAIKNEDYEKAAKIRDKIRKLKKGKSGAS